MIRTGTDKTFTGYSRETVIAKFSQSYFDDNGVRRWNVNNNIPFEDMLTDWLDLGLITQREVTASGDTRRAEEKAVIAEYFKRQAARSDEQIAEERAMAKAALGDDVVNIITGERY